MANDTTRMEAENHFKTALLNVAKNLSERFGTTYLETNPCACIYEAVTSLQRELAEARAELTASEHKITLSEAYGPATSIVHAHLASKGLKLHAWIETGEVRPGVAGETVMMTDGTPMDLHFGCPTPRPILTRWSPETPVEALQAPAPSDVKGEHIPDVGKLVPLDHPSVRGVLVDDGEPRRLVEGEIGWCAETSMLYFHKHSEPSSDVWQPLKLRPASEFGVAARGEPGLKKLPEGARVFVPDGPRRGPKVREYFFDPIWGHGVFQALRDYDDGDVNVQVCKLLDPALYAIPAGGEREDAGTVEYWSGIVTDKNQRIKELEAKHEVALAQEIRRIKGLTLQTRTQSNELERLRKAIGEIRDVIAPHPAALMPRYAVEAYAIAAAALSPSPAPAAETQGNAQHHSEGAKIPEGGSGSSAAESEGGEPTEVERLEQCIEVYERSCTQWAEQCNGLIAERDALSARLAACEERCRELEAGIRAQLGPLDQDQQTEVIARSLRSLLAPKAGGEDGAQS